MPLYSPSEAPKFQEGDRRFDWGLFGIILTILIIGILNIYSVSSSPEAWGPYLPRQAFFIGLGLVFMGVVMLFDYRLLQSLAYIFYVLNLLALFSVKYIGIIRNGAKRWIDLGFMNFQPSETMKIMVVLALAKYFHDRQSNRKLGFRGLLVPGLIVAIPTLVTMMQPDLGTGGHIAIIGTVMILFNGVRPKILMWMCLLAAISLPAVWKYGLKDYQKRRVITFVDPTKDPRGAGYNALQSIIAVGSGGVSGKGYKQGSQTQLQFTPEGHTDFIFTVLAEEWGFLGSLFLFAAYLYLFYRCVKIASSAREKFGSLFCVGVMGMMISQIFINVAMVTGIFPIVGIPLPLVSYGGTSILTLTLALGVMLNIGYRRSIF